MTENVNALVQFLHETLMYWDKKLINNDCTVDEITKAATVVVNNMDVYGSISDIAQFYGQSESNVRNVIARKMFERPKRKVLYSFSKFTAIMPNSWKKHN